jgi:hypothetical protein
MEYAALFQGLVGALSAMGAANSRSEAEDKARSILEAAQNEFGKIDIPTLEQITNKELGPSAFEKIKTDARLSQAQYGALDKLGEYANGGLTLNDQATLNAAMGKVSRQEGAGRNAIKNSMAARGTLGSGAELAMSLQNQQGSAERANQMGMDAAGKAQQRALEALMQRGELAGKMRSQDFSEQAQKAQAADIISRYNGTRQSQGYRDLAGLQMNRAQGMAGLAGPLAGSARNSGQIGADEIAGIGSGVNQGIASYATWKNNQRPRDAAPTLYEEDEDLRPAEKLDYE